MLKITVSYDVHGTTFALAGRLAGPWVQELRRCWQSWREEGGDAGGTCRVDLQETTSLDAQGKSLLSEMHRAGAAITARGCLMRAIVEDLTGASVADGHRRSLRI